MALQLSPATYLFLSQQQNQVKTLYSSKSTYSLTSFLHRPPVKQRRRKVVAIIKAYVKAVDEKREWGKGSAVLFDMVGVLCNREDVSRLAVVEVFDEMGVRVTVEDFAPFMGLGLLQPDPFLSELTSMFERSTEAHSVWVTLKRSSLKSKVQRNKLATVGHEIEYRCLVRATYGKKTNSTSRFLRLGTQNAEARAGYSSP